MKIVCILAALILSVCSCHAFAQSGTNGQGGSKTATSRPVGPPIAGTRHSVLPITSEASPSQSWLSALQFPGIDPTGATDSTAGVQKAVNAAAGNDLFFPPGCYRFDGTITSNLPICIIGAGNGAGPGPSAQANSSVTQFLMNSDRSDLFVVTTMFPSRFENFQINKSPGHRGGKAGIGIKLIGYNHAAARIATVANAKILGLGFTNVFTPIHITRPAQPEIVGCYFDKWGDVSLAHSNGAITLVTTPGVEGNGGFLAHNYFFGDATTGPPIYAEIGYTNVIDNGIGGGPYGVCFNIRNYPAGSIVIAGNHIENFFTSGIMIRSADGSPSSMVHILGNEFSNTDIATSQDASITISECQASPAWIANVVIANNISRNISQANKTHFWLQAGENVVVSNNVFEELSQNNPTGIRIGGVNTVGGLVQPILVSDNTFKGKFIRYSGAATFRDNVGMLFASLPVNAVDGSQIYCSDCASPSNPATAGGKGALVIRQNNAWRAY